MNFSHRDKTVFGFSLGQTYGRCAWGEGSVLVDVGILSQYEGS